MEWNLLYKNTNQLCLPDFPVLGVPPTSLSIFLRCLFSAEEPHAIYNSKPSVPGMDISLCPPKHQNIIVPVSPYL